VKVLVFNLKMWIMDQFGHMLARAMFSTGACRGGQLWLALLTWYELKTSHQQFKQT